MDSVHDRFRVLSQPAQVHLVDALFTIGDNCVKMEQDSMTYYTRCLRELPQITVNRIVGQSAVTPNSKKEKGFK